MSKANPSGSRKFLARLWRWKWFYGKNHCAAMPWQGMVRSALWAAPLWEKYRLFLAQIILRQQRRLGNDHRLRFEFALRFFVVEKKEAWRGKQSTGTTPELNYFLGASFAEMTNVYLKNIVSPAAFWRQDAVTRQEVKPFSLISNSESKSEKMPVTDPIAAMLYLRSGAAVHLHHTVNHAVGLPARSTVQAVAPEHAALPQRRSSIQTRVPVARVWANQSKLFAGSQAAPTRAADIIQQHWRTPAPLHEMARPQETTPGILGSHLYRRTETSAGTLEKNGNREVALAPSAANRWKAESAIDLTHRRQQSALEPAVRETTTAFFHTPASSGRGDSPATPASGHPTQQAGRVVGLAAPQPAVHDIRIPEVSRMAEEVYALLEKKLRTERERRGLFA